MLSARPMRMAVIIACLWAGMIRSGSAIDSVTRRSTGRPTAGEITSVTRTEIVVTPRVGEPVTIPANDVLDVDWEGAPAVLRLGRSQEAGGQLPQALKSYEQAATENSSAESGLRAEIEFLRARTAAKMALADPTRLESATADLRSFLDRNRDHYRYYEAQQLLGELGLAAEDYAAAEAAFAALAEAPWNELQMAARLGGARIHFARGEIDAAKAAFDEVAGTAVDDEPGARARKLEAMLGQAQCLMAQNQPAQAAPIFGQVVSEASENDTRLQAEAYIGQGEAFAATGDNPKAAITRFLIVDVVPSLAQHADLHAQALFRLSQLWPAVGQPARGAEASAKLEQDYPNSEWTKKLGGTTNEE